MRLEELALKVIESAEAAGIDFMAVGAIAAGAYGVPRSTRDVLAVQGTENLDMPYIEKWCALHGTVERLRNVLAEIPPLD